METVVFFGGVSFVVGLVVALFVPTRVLVAAVLAVLGLAILAGIAGHARPAPHEDAGGWLLSILAAFQFLGFLGGAVLGAARRRLRMHRGEPRSTA
jgi:hypothetical protein